jgi:hypothetical protein
LLLAAMSLAGSAAALRTILTPGSRSHSATYLLDAIALIVAVAGTGLETKSSAFAFEIWPRRARRRAIALALGGSATALVSCIAAVWSSGQGAPILVEAPVYAALIGGFGAGLAGLASLGWWYGGAYMARRIEAMGQDDW